MQVPLKKKSRLFRPVLAPCLAVPSGVRCGRQRFTFDASLKVVFFGDFHSGMWHEKTASVIDVVLDVLTQFLVLLALTLIHLKEE